MSDDPHAPTSAGPQPEEAAAAAPAPEAPSEPQPTPTVPPSEASWRTPPGTAAPAPGGDRPEVQVGLAFAGGLAAAVLLKVITR